MNIKTDLPMCHYFSQANPVGPGQESVPALLRRVAATIEDLGAVEVQDLVFQVEITEGEDRPVITVYLHEKAD